MYGHGQFVPCANCSVRSDLVRVLGVMLEPSIRMNSAGWNKINMKRRWANINGETSGLVGYRFRNEISVPADYQATENAVPT